MKKLVIFFTLILSFALCLSTMAEANALNLFNKDSKMKLSDLDHYTVMDDFKAAIKGQPDSIDRYDNYTQETIQLFYNDRPFFGLDVDYANCFFGASNEFLLEIDLECDYSKNNKKTIDKLITDMTQQYGEADIEEVNNDYHSDGEQYIWNSDDVEKRKFILIYPNESLVLLEFKYDWKEPSAEDYLNAILENIDLYR